MTAQALGSRAVLRRVLAGNSALCAACGVVVKFRARHQDCQVIANRYVDGRWTETLHFHESCYLAAGEPHGPADASKVLTR